MAMTYKHSGQRLSLVAAAARTAGNIVCDAMVASGANSLLGVAQSSASTAEVYWVETTGVHNLPVPSSGGIPGALLYAPGNTGASSGTGATVGNGIVLTATSTSNTLFAKQITARDSVTGKADVQLLPARY